MGSKGRQSLRRPEILALLADREMTGLEVARITGREQTNTSRDITYLYRQGLLTRRVDGRYVYYKKAAN
jgi:DNA-binding transcriptional ArsR family regulator